MNLKETTKRMDKKLAYRWDALDSGYYKLLSETGRGVYMTLEHLTAELVTKKLRSMGFNIVGDVPAIRDLRD